jgi:hypothetical protein
MLPVKPPVSRVFRVAPADGLSKRSHLLVERFVPERLDEVLGLDHLFILADACEALQSILSLNAQFISRQFHHRAHAAASSRQTALTESYQLYGLQSQFVLTAI